MLLHELFTFVVDAVAGLFAGFLLLRFWMQVLRMRPPSQLGQTLFQLTDWLVHPIRRVVPGFAGLDWASLIAALLVAGVSMLVDIWLVSTLSWAQLLVLCLFRLLQWILYGLMALLVLEAVFSWVNPHAPLAPFIRALNAPVLTPLRRLLPPMAGLDLSPLVALIALQVLHRLVSQLLLSAL